MSWALPRYNGQPRVPRFRLIYDEDNRNVWIICIQLCPSMRTVKHSSTLCNSGKDEFPRVVIFCTVTTLFYRIDSTVTHPRYPLHQPHWATSNGSLTYQAHRSKNPSPKRHFSSVRYILCDEELIAAASFTISDRLVHGAGRKPGLPLIVSNRIWSSSSLFKKKISTHR